MDIPHITGVLFIFMAIIHLPSRYSVGFRITSHWGHRGSPSSDAESNAYAPMSIYEPSFQRLRNAPRSERRAGRGGVLQAMEGHG